MGIMDNAAIERIATRDLTGDILKLLERYGGSDDVVFFLGRLVLQIEMIDCVPALMDIACDPERERYATPCQGPIPLLGDKGYDADGLRQALIDRGIAPCIPSKSNRKIQIDYDKTLYRQRHKIENMFVRLKDWRRVHTRYDRCAHTFMSAISIAATVIFWI